MIWGKIQIISWRHGTTAINLPGLELVLVIGTKWVVWSRCTAAVVGAAVVFVDKSNSV